MKKKLIIISFFVISCLTLFKSTNAQVTTPILTQLLAINEHDYIGKPLDSIINHLPPNYERMKIFAGGHYYTARNLRIYYSNRVWIDLHVREFNTMNPVDTNRVWNITQMRTEKLFGIAIYKGTNCYKGCNLR